MNHLALPAGLSAKNRPVQNGTECGGNGGSDLSVEFLVLNVEPGSGEGGFETLLILNQIG